MQKQADELKTLRKQPCIPAWMFTMEIPVLEHIFLFFVTYIFKVTKQNRTNVRKQTTRPL